ncbi:MAG: valine--tRNA ligase [Candidatus Thermoplasmatota archaeon]|nr:valine--tRNA ligase [Candidatus Thermoplasmatota archaeon]
MNDSIPTRYDPKSFESRWQALWEEHKLFVAPPVAPGAAHCTILLPPPNVTGPLTLGHSLGDTCMDILARWRRMQGVPTLWLPGVDHAGLATQMAVRKALEAKGVDVNHLSRENLRQEIENWKGEKETYIRRQLTAHGFSLDWTRYTYTMDPRYRKAVQTAFLRLYREGLIYRAEKMVNWDPKLLTAISDLEVIPVTTHGKLWYIRYPLEGNEGEGITVATTRPETLFGDVAVAVNPEDERHRHLVGKRVRLPLTDRVLPIIVDTGVDVAFGNGALKITPSHDLADLTIAKRHPDLPTRREVLDERAHLAGEFVPEPFRGLSCNEGRTRVVEALKEAGLLVKEEPHTHNVGRSERSNAPVEPRLSTQWFVDTSSMGKRALDAVREGKVRIVPDRWTNTYYHFMENLQDWCISRQILWGHEIPVWYCGKCGAFDAEESAPAACAKCGSTDLHADPDVLDTWFSSWLWPFATLGWPEETADLAGYFPSDVLVTGSDIVFFWVARMIMSSLNFRNAVPFPDVFLTGILTDKEGRKLSKHLGNSPDPLEFIDNWGADAFRFALVFPNPVDQNGWWDYAHHLEGGRNFVTKLWNVVRFVQGALPPGLPAPKAAPREAKDLFDRWILRRLAYTEREVGSTLSNYEFTKAASVLHQFLWREVADWYLEAQKSRLKGVKGTEAQRETAEVLLYTVDRLLRLLHPFLPHVTEELWHALPHEGEFLAVSAWPEPLLLPEDGAEEEVANLQEIVRGFRALSKEGGWAESERPAAVFHPTAPLARRSLESGDVRALVQTLAKLGSLEIAGEPRGGPASVSLVIAPGALYLARKGREAGGDTALLKEKRMVEQLLEKSRARLADPTFSARAPESVRKELESKVAELEARLRSISAHLEELP